MNSSVSGRLAPLRHSHCVCLGRVQGSPIVVFVTPISFHPDKIQELTRFDYDPFGYTNIILYKQEVFDGSYLYTDVTQRGLVEVMSKITPEQAAGVIVHSFYRIFGSNRRYSFTLHRKFHSSHWNPLPALL